MSFGGGGMMGGGGMFGPPGGSRSAAAPGGGLPFAGIPSELQKGVDKLLAEEPDHGEPAARFSYRSTDDSGKRLTLRALIFRHWHLGALAILLVTIVSVANQVGPLLIEYGINHGMRQISHGMLHHDVRVIVAHRLSTIGLADRVVLVDDGRVVADGTHTELMETSALYVEVLAQVEQEERDVPDGGER